MCTCSTEHTNPKFSPVRKKNVSVRMHQPKREHVLLILIMGIQVSNSPTMLE